MPSKVPNHRLGISRSRAVRSSAGERFLWAVRDGMISLAKAGTLATTLKAQAAQLTALGVRTSRGNDVDEWKLSAALKKMGVDRTAIKRWLHDLEDAAAELDVPEYQLKRQLWQDWLAHELRGWIEDGRGLSNRAAFEPVFVHPSEWKPAPAYPVMASPPAARLVYALLGMFEVEDFTDYGD